MEHLVESPELVSPASITSGPMTFQMPSTSPTTPIKLTGGRRLLRRIQKMSSSDSMSRAHDGASPIPQQRTRGLTSMSCVSLNSNAVFSPGHSYGNSYSSQFSEGYSTAPTSVASTPGVDMRFSDFKDRIRVISHKAGVNGGPTTPCSVPLPSDVRSFMPAFPMDLTPLPPQLEEDYFSRPVAVAKPPPKKRKLDFWGEMPDEIKMHVLQFLKPKEIVRCSRVSRSWHKMCFDGQLWGSLNAADFYRHIPSGSLVKLISAAGPFVKHLNLQGCMQMQERWKADATLIADMCQNLQTLSLRDSGMEQSSFHYFILRCPQLVELNVMNVDSLDDATMQLIAQSCPKLEVLDVSWCHNVSGRGLKKIIQSCLKLHDLRASETKGWNDKEFLLELHGQNTLERLYASHCKGMSDDSLKMLFCGATPEIDAFTERPLVKPRNFRHLNFSRNANLTDAGLQSLSHNVPFLNGLQVSKCALLTDDALSGILSSTPHLTHLDVEGLELLTNTTLHTLAKSPCASTLRQLTISYCENLGDTGMLPVLKACPELKSLLLDNTRISDLTLAEAADQVRMRNRSATTGNTGGKPVVGLRLEAYDCSLVNWTGVREILSRNSEFFHRPLESAAPQYPREIVSLKCYFGYQQTVDEHTKRVLKGELARATLLERKWAEYMMLTEEAGAGAGAANARRRRRRAREAALAHEDEEGSGVGGGGGAAGGNGMMGRNGRRRARSGGCAVM
ncbi:hypothetical protein MMC25_007895 [Agyrium rufum]|nr:hypothetical protein [Agyrium rufum]